MILLTGLPETDRDMELVTAFRRGDEDAFEALLGRHKDGVYSLVARTVGSEVADDLVQEVFIQIFRSLGRFRGESSLRTWIYRIAMNLCREHIRRKYRQPQVSLGDHDEIASQTDPVFDLTSKLVRLEIDRAVSSLSEMDRAVVELHYTQGLSYREMADALSCPAGTIKARVHDAIARLRQKLYHLVEEVGEV